MLPPIASRLPQKRHAPATRRNREPIEAVLRDVLPPHGSVLEIASGSGEHAIHFAAAFPRIVWQPSDADPASLDSIGAWLAESSLTNLLTPMPLDVRALPWQGIMTKSFDAVVAINMIHIAPWDCCESLMAGAAVVLRDGGFLLLYGPFKLEGRHTAPSNAAFDEQLRSMDLRYGVRATPGRRRGGSR